MVFGIGFICTRTRRSTLSHTRAHARPKPPQFVVPQLLKTYQEFLGLGFEKDAPLTKGAWAPGVDAFKVRRRRRGLGKRGPADRTPDTHRHAQTCTHAHTQTQTHTYQYL